jgi:hypothetical protein
VNTAANGSSVVGKSRCFSCSAQPGRCRDLLPSAFCLLPSAFHHTTKGRKAARDAPVVMKDVLTCRTMAVVRSPDFLRAPTAERTVGPARMIAESSRPNPELENKICQYVEGQDGAAPDSRADGEPSYPIMSIKPRTTLRMPPAKAAIIATV